MVDPTRYDAKFVIVRQREFCEENVPKPSTTFCRCLRPKYRSGWGRSWLVLVDRALPMCSPYALLYLLSYTEDHFVNHSQYARIRRASFTLPAIQRRTTPQSKIATTREICLCPSLRWPTSSHLSKTPSWQSLACDAAEANTAARRRQHGRVGGADDPQMRYYQLFSTRPYFGLQMAFNWL